MKYVLLSLLFAVSVRGAAPSIGGSLSGVPLNFNSNSWAIIQGFDLLNKGAVIYQATNGNDNATGTSPSIPVQTLTNALTKVSAGFTIFMFPGTNFINTNNVVLPDNVNLRGTSTNQTWLYGYADCSGVEDGLSGTGGPQINPGNNSQISDFSIVFDTNNLAPLLDISHNFASATHSGTWTAIGVSAPNPPSYRGFTNVFISRINVYKSWFDEFHVNSTNYCEATLRDCIFDSESAGISTQCSTATANNQGSYIRAVNCLFIARTRSALATANVNNNPNGTDFGRVYVNTDKSIILENCSGTSVTTDLAPFNSVNTGGASPFFYVYGGHWTNSNTGGSPESSGFYQINLKGWTTYNGTNVFYMPFTTWSGNTANTAVSAATTYFFPPNFYSTTLPTSDVSAATRLPTSRSMTIRNLRVVQSVAAGSGKNYTYTVMTNGVATPIVATVNGTSFTTAVDNTHRVLVQSGDEVGIKLVVDSGATGAKVSWSLEGQ